MARRQEREPVRSEITELPGGVRRIERPIRLPGLRHVNCYAEPDRRGTAIVDPGLPGPGTWRVLVERLDRADLRVESETYVHLEHLRTAGRAERTASRDGTLRYLAG